MCVRTSFFADQCFGVKVEGRPPRTPAADVRCGRPRLICTCIFLAAELMRNKGFPPSVCVLASLLISVLVSKWRGVRRGRPPRTSVADRLLRTSAADMHSHLPCR